MARLMFWIVAAGYPASSLAATVFGPRGFRPAAAGILVVTVASTLIGLLPASYRPNVTMLDLCSSFILAVWILIVAMRYPTAWSGVLLILQSVELALAAFVLGPDADELLHARSFADALFFVSTAIIAFLILAVLVKVLSSARAKFQDRTGGMFGGQA